MTSRNLFVLGTCALPLGLSVATLASAAATSPQDGDTYRTAPPSSNLHDVFRTIIKVPRSGAQTHQASNCACPMMPGARALPPKG